ncbi:NADH-quinone oxidoreductase subunit C [Candidatus Woesearchaeota archaeon]|nr:NADH-quinone oxidoreductase subunit C [Candidatus Woesearchaeota archaeon]
MNGLKEEAIAVFGRSGLEEQHHDELHVHLSNEEFLKRIRTVAEKGFLLADLFAVEESARAKAKKQTLVYVFEKRGYPDLLVLHVTFHKKATSIAPLFPSACWYEREIADGFGILFDSAYDKRRLFLHEVYPVGFHPLQKSWKNKCLSLPKTAVSLEDYPFKEVKGEGVYCVPVGPVHAGIIEPGHFRFSVIGETMFNLEVRMFWKHRGIEKMAEGKQPSWAVNLAEAVSGDETVANAWAYCRAVEKIAGLKIPARAEYLRMVFAEMERIYALLGDLAGMIMDVAYAAGASPFFILREEMLRWNAKLSGSRFFKNNVVVGGVVSDVGQNLLEDLGQYLHHFSSRCRDALNHSLNYPTVLDRLDSTGIVKKELVIPLHLSGPMARASGVATDVRLDHPYGYYAKIPPHEKIKEQGDVLARFKIKAASIEDSVRIIQQIIADIPAGVVYTEAKVKDGAAFSQVESCRGQNVHYVQMEQGVITRYKIRTASFCNWSAIEHAVLDNIIPDFPLINKSMNLSYAGTDL